MTGNQDNKETQMSTDRLDMITWTAPADDVAAIAGKTLTGGGTEIMRGERVVVGYVAGKKMVVRVAGRPALAVLADAYDAAKVELTARRQAEASRAAADLADRKAAAIAACPTDHETVTTRKWGNGDLMSACYVAADGTEIIASDLLDDHGCGVWYIPAADMAKARETKAAEVKAQAERASQPARKPLPRSMQPCPRCGTYCGGDCAAYD